MLNRTRRWIRIVINFIGMLIAATGLLLTVPSGSGTLWFFLVVLGYCTYMLVVDTRRNLFRDVGEEIEADRAAVKKLADKSCR